MEFFVYIMTNETKKPLYIGMTNHLIRRVREHKEGYDERCFTQRYALTKLVYFETHPYVLNAIQREKNLKRWYRQWKIDLIERYNPLWQDLSYCLRP